MRVLAIILDNECDLAEVIHCTDLPIIVARGTAEAKETLRRLADKKGTNGRLSVELVRQLEETCSTDQRRRS